MKLLKQQLRSKFKPYMAMFMVFLMVFGAMPLNVFANERTLNVPEPAIEAEPFTARIDGEDVLVPADGFVTVQVEGIDEPVEIEIPRYIYLDGERIAIDDDSIENIAPVVAPVLPLSVRPIRAAALTPPVGFIVSVSGALPSNPTVGQIGPEYTHPAYVTINGRIVSSRRYIVIINGVHFEAFCADPNLPGPETNAAVYELTGADGLKFRTVLRYGFPINPSLTLGDDDERAWHVYITRVAVAYVSRPNATWGNLTGGTRSALDNRVNGTGGAAAKANSPAITINGEVSSSQDGFEQQSFPFSLGHSRRTNCQRNPFRFEWQQSTPAGTRLYVDGSHVATAPTNPTDIFTVNRPIGQFRAASEFHFVMPQGSEGQTARVSLVGINNQYAGRVFVMQNPNDTDNWQDIVFYIPEVLAHAAYTWDYDPLEEHGRLRILKTDMQGNALGGAVFRITGPEWPDGHTVTVPASGWTSGWILPGTYTVTEVSPPSGFLLDSNPTQTIEVQPGQIASAQVANALSSSHFELPVEGSTGWVLGGAQAGQPLPMRNDANASATVVEQLQAGQGFRILEESGDWWRVALNGTGTEGWIQHSFALINMPDIIPSIIYDVTNARASVMRSSMVDIPSVTGQRLHSGRVNNPRLGMQEYILPTLYSTARLVQTAQNSAREQGYTLIMNESFRPRDVQRNVVTNLEALAAANSTVAAGFAAPWSMGWFISNDPNRVSNHQLGAAVDVELGRITGEQNHTVGDLSFTTLTANPLPMPTMIHELSNRAIVHTVPNGNTFAPTMTPAAHTLNNIMRNAGFTALSSEWWHFDDVTSQNRLNNLRQNGSTGSFDTTAIFSIAPQSNTSNPGNGDINPGGPSDGVATVTFRNERIPNGNGSYENGVTVQKICALTGVIIPGAVVRLRGLDNPSIDVTQVLTAGSTVAMPSGITSTVENGVWRINGLPPGAYEVIEIQAPDNFSMLPGPNAHAFYKEVGSDAHIMITFRNYPFGRIDILKVEGANGVAGNRPLAGATFRLEGFYPGQPARPLLRYAQTDAQGRIIFDDLPAGNFTITEIMPPTGYTFGSVRTWSVNVGWGQTYSVVAYNVPKSNLTVYKACSNTGALLNGATFELRDPTTGETWVRPDRA